MGIDGLAHRAAHLSTMRAALWIELHDARLDDDATRSKPSGGVALPTAAVSRQRRRHLRASSPRVEPAASFSFPAVRRRRTQADPAGIAAGLSDGDLDLPDEGKRARTDAPSAGSGSAGSSVEIVSVVARHSEMIGAEIALRNGLRTPIAGERKNAGCSVETARHATSHLSNACLYHAANMNEFDSGENRRTSRRIMPAHL
ncbi:hypothetical protein [Methylosinus sp. Sm6]|uniref:hypothetical protein n=1 Tax=Methylosinus sp. Sm6 TaxID=2866948 RepID=UPI0021038810|nr:hypothetical protein [Methylosinus sp. Sm6]